MEVKIAVEDMRDLVHTPTLNGVVGRTKLHYTHKLYSIEPAPCETPDRQFPLWFFARDSIGIFIRAETEEEAFEEAANYFPLGVTIAKEGWTPLRAAEHYEKTVRSGWLHRPPTPYEVVAYKISSMERAYLAFA
jgi:hypothetical protein